MWAFNLLVQRGGYNFLYLYLHLVGHFCSIPLGGFSYNLSHLEEIFYVFENIVDFLLDLFFGESFI